MNIRPAQWGQNVKHATSVRAISQKNEGNYYYQLIG